MQRSPGGLLAACGFVLAATGTAPANAFQAVASEASYHESISGTLVTFEMVRVPAGRVVLDGPDGARAVEVASFYIGRTEVTWDMYDVFALRLDQPREGDAVARPSNPYGAPDYGWGHAGFPVMSVTAHAAQAFCAWLSQKTGRVYRLPTEAEWVHAANLAAGGDGLAADEREALAWFRGNSSGRTHPAGARRPDALGLFDLFGNTAEWVTTEAGDAVTRGASFRDDAAGVGPAARAPQQASWNETDPQLPKSRWWLSDAPFVGFRLVSTIQGVQP